MQNEPKPGIWGRRIVSNPKLQFLIMGFFVGLATLNIAFLFMALKTFEQTVILDLSSYSGEQREVLERVVLNQIPQMMDRIIIFSVVVIAFTIIAGVSILNHISGPAYAIKRFLDDLAEGDTSRYPLVSRKYDFLKDVVFALNYLVEKKFLNEKK